jgi:hypothetical protein
VLVPDLEACWEEAKVGLYCTTQQWHLEAHANAITADSAVVKQAVRLLHLARIPDPSSTLPTLRRMPFPGPAKEQRANTSHNFQVGNDEKKSQRKERIREQTSEPFFEKQLYGPKLRARHTNLDQVKPEREKQKKTPALPAGDDMDRREEKLFSPKCKQGCLLFQIFCTLSFSFFP